jgi:hypothetical protein
VVVVVVMVTARMSVGLLVRVVRLVLMGMRVRHLPL